MGVSLPFFLVKKILNVLASSKRNQLIEACKNPSQAQEQLKEKLMKNSRIPFPDAPVDYKYYEGLSELTLEKVVFKKTIWGSTGKKKKFLNTNSYFPLFKIIFYFWPITLFFI